MNRRGSCPSCGTAVTMDDTGKLIEHPPVASCDALWTTLRRELADASKPHEKPCCRFFGIGHTMYKGIYLPSVEEYVAHGYRRENFGHAMLQWQAEIDATGRLA